MLKATLLKMNMNFKQRLNKYHRVIWSQQIQAGIEISRISMEVSAVGQEMTFFPKPVFIMPMRVLNNITYSPGNSILYF
jgi:hypothetical protein